MTALEVRRDFSDSVESKVATVNLQLAIFMKKWGGDTTKNDIYSSFEIE